MASETITALLANMEQYQYNPALIQRDILDHLEFVSSGKIQIVDPTNPFIAALESACCLTTFAISKNEALNRRQYSKVAQTYEEIYLHMSDRDYADRFASPSKTKIGLAFDQSEIMAKMVDDTVAGIRKLVIPRNTEITVSDVTFSLQYPVVIRQLAHGGLQVVYDTEVASPLLVLDTNVIDWETRRSGNIDWLYFEIEVEQFKIATVYESVSAATSIQIGTQLDDQFYYARVFYKSGSKWVEMKTTHSDQIYDPYVPTAVVRVYDNIAIVTIPQIYITNQLVESNVRVDFYQTKGNLSMDLGSYPLAAYSASWKAIDTAEQDVFVAPLSTMKNYQVFSTEVTTGGNDAIALDELRARVINNASGPIDLPITNVQMDVRLRKEGYEVVKNVDNITNRVFLATRQLPAPSNEKLITAASASIETMSTTIKAALQLGTVYDNESSITISPDTLYQNRNGVLNFVQTATIQNLLALAPDKRALAVTEGNFYYTPFHYVLDYSGAEFDVRPYYLDSPKAITKSFVSENDTTLLQVSTDSYAIVRTATGYKLTVMTSSSDGFLALADDQVHAQLAYVPAGEKDYAYLNGVLIGKDESSGERVYEFDLATNYHIDSGDHLQLSKFTMYNTEPRLTGAALTTNFAILYATSAVLDTQWTPNVADEILGVHLLPDRIAAVTHEVIRLEFGKSLDTLWAKARSVIDETSYRRWETDVLRYYEKDVFETDPDTESTVFFDETGAPFFKVLHHKGDPVLDAQGVQQFHHRKGDVMLDPNGDPVVADVRGLLRQFDVMLLEGVYWFATDSTAIAYRTEMVDTFLAWMFNDLGELKKQTLDKTRLYFYPKATQGSIPVSILDGRSTTIDAGQSFVMDMYVTKSVYENDNLRKQLDKATVQIISNQLKNQTVSISAINKELSASFGDDVIDFKLSGLGDTLNLHVLTVMDDVARCSLRKRLKAQADNTLVVEEDITINYIKHTDV